MKSNKTSTFRGQTKPFIGGLSTVKGIKSKSKKETHKTEAEIYEYRIQKLLDREGMRLHKEIFSAQKRGNMKLFHDLQYSRQTKYAIYEKKIRAKGYLDKIGLNIVIIEDLQEIRSKIIEILPLLLGDKYRIEFQEIDNLEDAKSEIEIKNLVGHNIEKTFSILDNNFYSDNETENIKINAGVELYKFLFTSPIIRKTFLENITILSNNDNIRRKFPEGVNITNGKSKYEDNYILEISNWIKSILEK